MKQFIHLFRIRLPFLAFVVSMYAGIFDLNAQNTAVQWSGLNGGLGQSNSSATTIVWSSVGQGFAGAAQGGNVSATGGFLANTSFSTHSANNGQNAALAFDGTNDYVEIPHTPALAPKMITVECWAKSNTSTWNTTGALISKRDAFILHPEAGTKRLRFYIHMPDRWMSATADLTVDLTQWHHYAGTFDKNYIRLFVDGVQVDAYFYQSELTGGTPGALYIGSDKDAGARYFNGLIDEVRIWNYARTAGDISANMNNTLLSPTSAGLLAYYHFDDGAAGGSNSQITSVIDATPNGFNGTVQNFALSGNNSNYVASFPASAAPGMVTLVSPANNATGQQRNITLIWNELSTATSYRVQASTDSTFASPLKDTVVSGTSLQLSGLGYLKNYFYRVQGINDAATGNWCAPYKFTTIQNIALAFDGSNDHVTFGNNASLKPTNAVTVEAWVKTNASEAEQFIISSGHDASGLNGYHLVLWHNRVHFWLNNYTTEVISPGTLAVGTWYHLAATYSSTAGAKLYINGVLQGSDPSPANTISYDSNPVTIGVLANYPIYYFNGLMDEVRVWGVERTAQEIYDNMSNYNLSPASPGLLGYYKYDQGSPGGNNAGINTLQDQTANGNNGTLTNFALGGNNSNWVAGKSLGTTSLGITAFIQGMYNAGVMTPDTVAVYLKNSINYSTLESVNVVLNAAGAGTAVFQNDYSGSSYYVAIKHRNSIETWSAAPQAVTEAGLNYNFSTAQSKAYGDNLVLKNGKWCIYSGDVNQDGIVDFSDLSAVDNAQYNFVGGYVSTDLTGDDFVDYSDLSICDNNQYNFVSVISPVVSAKPVRQEKPRAKRVAEE